MIFNFYVCAEREVEGLKFSMCVWLAAKGESTTLISFFFFL